MNEVGEHFDYNSSLLRYAMIHEFKGLDSNIVIIADVDNIQDRDY